MRFWLIIIGLVWMVACHHSSDPDPCASMKPVTADFVIEEYVSDAGRKTDASWYNWINYATDTALFNRLHFKANQDSTSGSSYEWTVGITKVYKKEFDMYFGQRPVGNDHIEVNLKVHSPPNHACFPSDSGVAESIHHLVLLGAREVDRFSHDAIKVDSSLVVTPMAGTYVGTYLEIPQFGPVSATPTHINDTLIISLGKLLFPDVYFYSHNWYYFSDHRRKDQFISTNHYLPFDVGGSDAWGYKQFCDESNGDFFLTPDNNTMQCTFASKVYFLGKRIKN